VAGEEPRRIQRWADFPFGLCSFRRVGDANDIRWLQIVEMVLWAREYFFRLDDTSRLNFPITRSGSGRSVRSSESELGGMVERSGGFCR
jgi:hypothetical protein